MANYLQRIVASGARTSSVAKPPAAARVPMSRIDSHVHRENVEEIITATTASEEAVISVQPARASYAQASSDPRSDPMTEDKVTPATPTPTALLHPTAAKNSAFRSSVRAPESLRMSFRSDARERFVQRVADDTSGEFVAGIARNQDAKAHRAQEQNGVKPVPVNPEDSVRDNNSEEKQTPFDQKHAYLAPKGTHPERGSLVDAHVDKKWKMAAEAAEVGGASTPASTEGSGKAPTQAPVHADVVVSHPYHNQAMYGNSLPALRRSTAAEPGQNRISIGRIDVQVSNEGTQQAETPHSARAAASTNLMERLYLSRFFISI